MTTTTIDDLLTAVYAAAGWKTETTLGAATYIRNAMTEAMTIAPSLAEEIKAWLDANPTDAIVAEMVELCGA